MILLLFLVALSYTQGFPTPGKELIYDYNARIRVGTYEPLSFASQFILEGKLHLQHENKQSILARFTDLSYKLYNGELNNRNEHESRQLPLPEETVDLLRIFRIEYDENGKLSHLTTESGEHKYARNMKKAIASLLQLDLKNLQLDLNIPHAFITEERSIYGQGLEEYNVIPQESEIIVQKMRDVKTSRNWYNYFGLNMEPLQFSEYAFQSPVSINSHRQYILSKNSNDIQIKRLEAHGGIYYHLLRGLSDAQYLSVNQTLDLLETIPIESKYLINSEDRTDQIQFQLDHEIQSGAIPDLTLGRSHLKQEERIKMIQEVLGEALNYLQANQLEIDAPDAKKGQAINRLHRMISHLDIPSLEIIYARLNENSNNERDQQILRIYQQILPLIGTRATVIFIRNLIRKSKIEDDLKIEMLNKLPFYLRMRNEKLLEEIEDLMDLGDLEEKIEVRRAAVLCFASLVNKIFVHRIHNHEQHHINNEENILFHYPGNWNMHNSRSHQEHLREEHSHREDQNRLLLERYILRFMNLLEQAQDYSSQLLYMQALNNIQIGVSKYLEPYVNSTAPNSNRHLRFLAICASIPGVLENPSEMVYRTYWPIFTNRDLHLEIRAAAYFVIMSTQPTMNKLWNIYWFIQTEQCPELYNFIYTHLKSLAAVKNPIFQGLKINAQQILRYVRKPNRKYLSSNYIIDYKDPQFDFGGMLQAMIISTSSSKALYIDLTNNINNVPIQLYSLFLKIDGLDPALAQKLQINQLNNLNIEELNQLLRIISSLKENPNIHIEYSILQHNQVIRIGYFNQQNIKDLMGKLQNLQIENIKCLQNALNIHYNILWQFVLPNDLGLPTIIQLKAPQVTNNLMKISREIVNKIANIHGDIRLHLSMQTMFDLGFYNPIPDVWQGVQRVNSYDQVIPLNANLAINTQQQSLKLTINNNQDLQKGAIGLRSHVRNIVYVFGDETKNYLKQSNSQCDRVEEINREKENRREVSLLDLDDENTGRRYQIKVFDSERQVSRSSLINLLKSLLRPENINDQNIPMAARLLYLRNIWCRLILLPGIGRSGIIIRSIPSLKNPVSHIDLSLRYNSTLNKDDNSLSPSTRINTRATYAVKSLEEKLLKTWDINAIIDMNSGSMINNLKMQISKIVPEEKDYRICLEGVQKWNLNNVSADLSISIGNSIDSKCAKDVAHIDLNMQGSSLLLPLLRDIKECASNHVYEPFLDQLQMSHIHDIKCLEKHTNLINNLYKIKLNKVPDHLWQKLRDLIKFITLNHNIHYTQEIRDNSLENNEIQIGLSYRNNDYDLEIIRREETYNIFGIDSSNLLRRGIELKSNNYYYSKKFLWLHQLGLLQSCIVGQQRILDGYNHIIEKAASDDWTEYLKDSKQIFNIAVKRIGEEINTLGLRINLKEDNLEIIPNGEEYQIILNSERLEMQNIEANQNSYYQGSWFNVGFLNSLHKTLILRIHEYELYLEMNKNYIKMDMSQLGSNLEGICFGN